MKTFLTSTASTVTIGESRLIYYSSRNRDFCNISQDDETENWQCLLIVDKILFLSSSSTFYLTLLISSCCSLCVNCFSSKDMTWKSLFWKLHKDAYKTSMSYPYFVALKFKLNHCEYALVIVRFRVQYDQYFPSFSYFADLFHEPLGEWNSSKIWETRKILAILCEINVR